MQENSTAETLASWSSNLQGGGKGCPTHPPLEVKRKRWNKYTIIVPPRKQIKYSTGFVTPRKKLFSEKVCLKFKS